MDADSASDPLAAQRFVYDAVRSRNVDCAHRGPHGPRESLLFSLFLHGRLDYDAHPAQPEPAIPNPPSEGTPGPRRAATLVTLGAGAALLAFTDTSWAHAIGVASLSIGAALTFFDAAIAPEHD